MAAISEILNTLTTLIIYAVALLLPIIFTPFTTEFYDTAKFFLIAVAALLLLLLWAVRILTEGRITITKTPLDLFLILYLLVAVLSTLLSPTPYTSLFGQLPRVFGSLLFQISLVLLYFMVVSNLRGSKAVNVTTNLMITSGIILALVSLLSYFKLFFPWAPAQNVNFSLAGSPSAGTIYLAMLIPIVLTSLVKTVTNRNPLSTFYFITLLIFNICIILVGNLASWVGILAAYGFFLYRGRIGLKPAISGLVGLFVGLAIVSGALAILSYTPTLKNVTPLGQLSSDYNHEIQLPFPISWKISASAFRDSPILGTGPATYLYNFTAYKPIEYNQTPFWNLRISTAHNQYLQTWAELGGAGVILLILLATTFGFFALRRADSEGLGLAGVIFLSQMALAPATVLTACAGFIILALFMNSSHSIPDHEFSINLRGAHVLIPTLIILPILALAAGGFFYLGKLGIGEYYERLALNATRSNRGLDAYNNLVQAEKANPKVDLYRVNLAQTNFALANAIAAQRKPTEASPSGSLTDQDRQNIQQFLQQSIAEGRAAVALSPRSSANWEILALIYRQISGVAPNALQFSLDAYGRAIARDPLNPLLRLAVGGVYYQAKNYDLAIRFFDDAVSLKPDYPNSLYNLAIALRDKGNLAESVRVAERLVSLLSDKPESKDYQTATALLKELKEKVPSKTQPPAASSSAELEKQGLPKVLDIGKPEQISTPPAVKKQ